MNRDCLTSLRRAAGSKAAEAERLREEGMAALAVAQRLPRGTDRDVAECEAATLLARAARLRWESRLS